ncbi:hypothetical protein [Ideonella sp. BN130291]|uniref:hypothetical protein n=1 Tax=Ideonella sp. BN130291 TaxID=3112940 RepID=UPI002E25EABB|nr:hypothetical protein [Ideonella sp. BN130291]
MKRHRAAARAGGLVAAAIGLAVCAGTAAAQRADVQTVTLGPQERASGPGGTSLLLEELSDSRCRAAERCSPGEAAARAAVARVSVRMADGQAYAATLALRGRRGRPSPSAPAHAKLGDLLVELVGMAPEGRELPADGPGGRPQRATLRITPAQRVAVAAGAAVDLQRAGFTLRVLAIDDHRCPRDVMCAVAGHVQIDVELSAGNAPAERVSFGSPAAPKQVHAWRGHEIELCDVLPRRASLARGEPEAPLRAEFFVSPVPAVATRGSPEADAAARRGCVPPVT